MGTERGVRVVAGRLERHRLREWRWSQEGSPLVAFGRCLDKSATYNLHLQKCRLIGNDDVGWLVVGVSIVRQKWCAGVKHRDHLITELWNLIRGVRGEIMVTQRSRPKGYPALMCSCGGAILVFRNNCGV
jgi:hypothetical protein